MYTRRIYSLPVMIGWTRRYIYMFIVISTIPVILYDFLNWKWLYLPWLPIGLIGTALAFIIGFKNNASYGRLWEARKIWGGIVNSSRSFAIMLNDFVTNEYAKEPASEEELFTIRKTMILRHALRKKKTWESSYKNKSDLEYMEKIKVQEYVHTLEEELEGYLSEEDKKFVLGMNNKQAACVTLQSKQLKALKFRGLIDDFRHMEMEKILVEFFTLQGKAERIKNFPYPRQFATLNLYFAWVFVFLLPFGLMHEFDKIGIEMLKFEMPQYPIFSQTSHWIADNFVWLTIPFSVVISWIFFTMERIGDVSESPFEGIGNDVPITTMSRGIEIDIRQIIGDNSEEIPAPHPEVFHTQM